MAIAITPDAYLFRTASTAWDVYFSVCGWRRIDVDRAQNTILMYLGNAFVGNGFQLSVDASRKLIAYDVLTFTDMLEGAGPTLGVGEWWFLGLTCLGPDTDDDVQIYYGKEGDASLTHATATHEGQYQYRWHGVGARPGADGADGAYRLHGSAALDRSWQNRELSPTEMLAEFHSPTVANMFEPFAVWDMTDAATAIQDATANDRDLTLTLGSGSITTTDDPDFDTGATVVEGTAAATWGPWSATATGSVAVGVTSGLAQGEWGPWQGFAAGTVTEAVTSGSADGTWGPWVGTADGDVLTDVVAGTASGTWGPWVGTASGDVTGTRKDTTFTVGPTRGPGNVVGATRESWAVGPSHIERED